MDQGYEQPSQTPHMAPGGQAALHSGVASFMNGVYGWMAVGLGLTAAVAWGLSQSMDTLVLLYTTPLKWVIMFGPVAMAWFLPARIPNMDRGMALAVFGVFAALMGAALAYVPLIAASHPGILTSALVTTIGIFAGTAAFGFFTKKDLTGMGQFLLMALIGAIIASVGNMFFFQSEGMSMGVSVIVAIAAAGLTAYHTQAIKQLYLVNGGQGNLAILGALLLYVDFINLFLSLLRLMMGNRD